MDQHMDADERWSLLCDHVIDSALGALNAKYDEIAEAIATEGVPTRKQVQLLRACGRAIFMILTNNKVQDSELFDIVGDLDLGDPPCERTDIKCCCQCETKDSCSYRLSDTQLGIKVAD